MAYRVKGYLTKKQREQIGDLITNYYRLVSGEETPQILRETVECVYRPFILLAQFALYADDVKIINKIIAPPSKMVKGES